jgi:anti-anti-sigma factor
LNDHETLHTHDPPITVETGQQPRTATSLPDSAGDAVPLLTVALVPAPDRLVVRLTGEADLSTASLLTGELARAAALGTPSVIVDVAGARFWDCSGLHALADLTSDLGRAGRQVRVVGAGAQTRRLIAMADFSAALELDGPVQLSAKSRREPRPPRAAPVWERPVAIPA